MNSKYLFSGLLISLSSFIPAFGQVKSPPPYGPVPSENQLNWQKMEYYAFVHLSVNTYTDMPWGKGDEDPTIFNPTKLDCRQWARICKDAGMKGIILTAKHHSGFCLWPSKYTEYSVKNSPWRNGNGDLVREMSDACKEYGLKFGVYLSPWDRNHTDYGKPEYITYFRNQLRELLTNYGDVFEAWFDGANGGSGYYGGANETRTIDPSTYYDWQNTYKLVRTLQPKIVIWNDGGDRADLRWVGTEAGYVGETNWSLLNATGEVTENMLRYGLENGNAWVPGEVNTSIRPEWFYHKKEDEKVKTLPQLMEIYYNSIGRNGTLLLNFPIMPNGLIHEFDEKAVVGFAKAIGDAFAVNLTHGALVDASNVRAKDSQFSPYNSVDKNKDTYWATDDGVTSGSLTLRFQKPISFNRFLVQEHIQLGQRVKSFTVEALVDSKWEEVAKETTIVYKRILRFKTVTTNSVRLTINNAKSNFLISNIEMYLAPQILAPPTIIREKSGHVRINPADFESQIFYTLDGTTPSIKSDRYTGSIKTIDGKVTVKCIAHDPRTGKNSIVAEENFDVAKTLWKITGVNDEKAYAILDGDVNTQWYQDKSSRMPAELVVDLGRMENLTGFRYLPDQHWWAKGIIVNYEFYVSDDGNNWISVDKGEFANIKNSPTWQIRTFKPMKARFIKLQALSNTQQDDAVGYSEVDIITQ